MYQYLIHSFICNSKINYLTIVIKSIFSHFYCALTQKRIESIVPYKLYVLWCRQTDGGNSECISE